jgi:hypothetical protein
MSCKEFETVGVWGPQRGKPRSREGREDRREEEKILSDKAAKEQRTPGSRIFLLGVLCSLAASALSI